MRARSTPILQSRDSDDKGGNWFRVAPHPSSTTVTLRTQMVFLNIIPSLFQTPIILLLPFPKVPLSRVIVVWIKEPSVTPISERRQPRRVPWCPACFFGPPLVGANPLALVRPRNVDNRVRAGWHRELPRARVVGARRTHQPRNLPVRLRSADTVALGKRLPRRSEQREYEKNFHAEDNSTYLSESQIQAFSNKR